MQNNRSVPTNILLPHLVYQNVDAAIDWLTKAFGFEEHYRFGGPPSNGAQMHLGDAWIMLTRARSDRSSPAQVGVGTQSLSIFVDDVQGHFARAKSAGAEIVEQPHETAYGEFQFAAIDPEGHHWLFSRHARDVSPEAWGGKLASR